MYWEAIYVYDNHTVTKLTVRCICNKMLYLNSIYSWIHHLMSGILALPDSVVICNFLSYFLFSVLLIFLTLLCIYDY